MDLNGTIRTIGLYQPFASLMLHGKIETRWVEEGRKPPFPLGVYLIYATKKEYSFSEFVGIAGTHNATNALKLLQNERPISGVPIGIGELIKVYEYDPSLSAATFVSRNSKRMQNMIPDKKNDGYITKKYVLWCLEFAPVRRLKYTFDFTEGKQGVGILSDEAKSKIVLYDTTGTYINHVDGRM